MADSEEVSQRRREKILSRVHSEQSQEGAEAGATGDKSDVFDRYKQIKMKQAAEKKLITYSRCTGFLTLPLSFIIPPWTAILLVILALAYGAYYILNNNKITQRPQASQLYDWITKRIPLVASLRHIDLIILIAKLAFNTLLSFIMTTVLINAAFLIHRENFEGKLEL